jgi:monoamine oxidase
LLSDTAVQGRRIVVAGAGLAGLSAAHELARHGASVTLVEGRDRVGGRVWTRRAGMAAGQHAELGGEFVDHDHGAMRRLTEQFGLDLVPVLPGGFTHRYRAPGAVRSRSAAHGRGVR